ncbi:MAG TPA: methyltransferase domain-containing protein, partial [Desulfomonilaceae bacterium]|nr:methyltransferase domain-containing protein [Desulfomonilaceae bacterium]
MGQEDIKKAVRDRYARMAKNTGLYSFPFVSCCDGKNVAEKISRGIGYSAEDLQSVPAGANLGLGCGNPVALAALKEGETVVDLGSGAGFDCFLAANQVGKNGRVIGVDMTPEMIDKARENARNGDYRNV